MFAQTRRRPVERCDWSRTAREYRFADDGSGLVASGSTSQRQGLPRRVTRIATTVG